MKFNKIFIISNLKYSPFLIFIASVIAAVLGSCDSLSDCQLTANRQVKLGFFNKHRKDSSVAVVYIYNLNDTGFYTGLGGTRISLTLSPQHDTSTFIFKTDSLNSPVSDTLIFYYKRELMLVSSDCGFNMSYIMNDTNPVNFTRTKIDTILELRKSISADVDINYMVLLKPIIKKASR
jgi:hypothetical protein